MLDRVFSFGAALGISIGAAAFQTAIVPEEHSVPAVVSVDSVEPAEQSTSQQRQLRVLIDGLRFEDLGIDTDVAPERNVSTPGSIEKDQGGTTIDQTAAISQLIDGLELLEEFEGIDLRSRIAALSGAVASSGAGRASTSTLSTPSKRERERSGSRSANLLRRSSGNAPTRNASAGGVGGGVAATSSQPQLGGANFSLGTGSSSSTSVASSIDRVLSLKAAQSAASPSGTSLNSSIASVSSTQQSSSGRPQLTADGKYGIPNHQYWTFDFTDKNNDNVVNRADADLHFADYLVGLEADLEAAKQVVKFSPLELQSIYSDLNSQVPPEKSPSYLTFMIIDFPVKGFYLPYDEIPDNPGLPAGAVD